MTKNIVDVFVLTYNRINYFKTYIKYLYVSTKYPFRLFVIDNGSIDGTRKYIIELERQGLVYKHLFNEKNLPLASAYTECFNKFKDELNELIVTSPDDIMVNSSLRYDWLEVFVKKIQSDKNIGCINFTGCRASYKRFVERYDK